jgi:hypothetical protein
MCRLNRNVTDQQLCYAHGMENHHVPAEAAQAEGFAP